MERKTYKLTEIKIDEALGIFEGYGSAFRTTPDKDRDIVKQGAFTKTIQENPQVPVLYMHNAYDVALGFVALSEDEHGLKVHGQLVMGIQKAKETLLLMKAGIIKSLSIGYETIQRDIKDGIRYLTEVKVMEVSLVIGAFACDDQAVITNVKTQYDDKLAELDTFIKSGRVLSAANIAKARAAMDAIQALLDAAEASVEPEKSTLEAEEAKAAAQLESVLSGINAEVSGFDTTEMEKNIDVLLAKINN